MSELDRLEVTSPVSEAQETNGKGTGILYFKGYQGIVTDFTGSTFVTVLLLAKKM